MTLALSDRPGNETGTEESAATASGAGSVGRLDRILGPTRIAVGVLLFALVVLTVAHSWDDVRSTLARISPLVLVLCEALVLVGLGASVLTWRVTAGELGSTVRIDAASKIYLLGQLAKYLPGSFWVLPAQMELASLAGVPRVRALAVSMVAIGVNLVTGLAIGMLVVPTVVSGGPWRGLLLVTLVAACAVALSPRILTRLLNVGLRLVRRPELEREISWRGILSASGWSVVSWASYGASLWVLAVAIGAPAGESFLLCIAGVALAMTVGFLVLVAPSGIGVREAVIVAVLAPVLDAPAALALALVLRLVFTLADLAAAALVLPIRIQPARLS